MEESLEWLQCSISWVTRMFISYFFLYFISQKEDVQNKDCLQIDAYLLKISHKLEWYEQHAWRNADLSINLSDSDLEATLPTFPRPLGMDGLHGGE